MALMGTLLVRCLDVLFTFARSVQETRDVIWTPEIALSAWCRRSELSIVCDTISS